MYRDGEGSLRSRTVPEPVPGPVISRGSEQQDALSSVGHRMRARLHYYCCYSTLNRVPQPASTFLLSISLSNSRALSLFLLLPATFTLCISSKGKKKKSSEPQLGSLRHHHYRDRSGKRSATANWSLVVRYAESARASSLPSKY